LSQLSVVSLSLLFGSKISSSLLLFLELLVSNSLLLHSVDGLNQDRLVLELVTLGGEVEFVVDVLSDFLGLSVLSQESSKHSLSAHPEHLNGHSCVSCTLSLTEAGMSSLSLSLVDSPAARSGVHGDCLLNDEAVLVELPNVLS